MKRQPQAKAKGGKGNGKGAGAGKGAAGAGKGRGKGRGNGRAAGVGKGAGDLATNRLLAHLEQAEAVQADAAGAQVADAGKDVFVSLHLTIFRSWMFRYVFPCGRPAVCKL